MQDIKIKEETPIEYWYDNMSELPDTWTLGEIYGEYLDYQDYEIEKAMANINYSHDEHTYKDGYEMRMCALDGIFGRW